MTSAPDTALLCATLETILRSADNAERRRAESSLSLMLQSPFALSLLTSALFDLPRASPGARQLAAVLLRRRVSALWSSASASDRSALKDALLSQLLAEPSRAVRLALAHAAACVARADCLDGGEWPALPLALSSMARAADGEVRALSMAVAFGAAEVFGDGASDLSRVVLLAVADGAGDAVVSVRRAAFRAAAAVWPFAVTRRSTHDALLAALVPRALAAPETAAMEWLELLPGTARRRHGPVVRGVAEAMLRAFGAASRGRRGAAEWLVALVTQRPRLVRALELLGPMVDACTRAMAEDDTMALPDAETLDSEDADDRTEEDAEDDPVGARDGDEAGNAMDLVRGSGVCMCAARLLSTLAAHIPSRYLTAALLPFVAGVAENPAAAASREKKSAILALACLAEGAAGFLRRRVSFVLQFTHTLLHDADPVPREAAAFALTHFCLHLQPDILNQHAELVSMLVPLLRDESDAVRRRVASALEALCEGVGEDITPYVSTLLPAVVDAAQGSSLATQTALCGVIAAIAVTRTPAFAGYAGHCLELMKPPLCMTQSEARPLRAKATEAAGIVANAMGREAFLPHLPFFMERVAENLRSRRAELREESFGFLSNICETLKLDFIPYLDDAVTCALQSIHEDRAQYKNCHPLKDGAVGLGSLLNSNAGGDGKDANADSCDEDADDDDDDAEEIHAVVRTADVEEKSSAVQCIGIMAEVLLADFGATRLEPCWNSLLELDGHFHANIRSNVLLALARIVKAAHGTTEVDKSETQDTLAPSTREMLSFLLQEAILPCLRDEEDKSVVASACDAMELLFNFFGPQVLADEVNTFVPYITDLLQQRTTCQCTEEDTEDEEEKEEEEDGVYNDEDGNTGVFPDDNRCGEEHSGNPNGNALCNHEAGEVQLGEDHDDILMDAVCDMLEAFAKAYGPSFAPHAATLLPLLLPYAASDRPGEDLVMATGCVATLVEAMRHAAAPFVDAALDVALRLISTADESAARANCAYLLRAIVECCPERFSTPETAAPLLRALWDLAGREEEAAAAVDNAVSACCSMLRCLPIGTIPLESVAPSLLRLLPMRVDRTENTNAVRTVAHLMATQRDALRRYGWLDTVRCAAALLASPAVAEEDKQCLLAHGIVPFAANCMTEWHDACGQMPTELQAALQHYNCF